MPLIKEERDAAEAPVPHRTSRPPHDHGDLLFMEIPHQISCKYSMIMSQAAEFPRDVPPGIAQSGQMVRRRPAATDSNGIARAASYIGEALDS